MCVSIRFRWALSVVYGIVVLQNRGEKTSKKRRITHMKDQLFGIEIEITAITRKDAAKVMADYFGTIETYIGGTYQTYTVSDQSGRIWKAMSDASIIAQLKDGSPASSDYKCEIVSPICKYEDIETIQEIVRKLRAKNAIAPPSCAIHIHINGEPYTARSIKNFVNIMESKEDLLFKAVGVTPEREGKWCKKAEPEFIEKLNGKRNLTKEEIKNIWYSGDINRCLKRYDFSRYHACNLHSLWQKNTLEVRIFPGTTHAGKIKAYIQLCLAISHQALTQQCASARLTITDNPKYAMRCWMLRMGMIGKEYETARYHLLENLSGDTAFRHGRVKAAA